MNSRLTLESSQETTWNEMRAHYKRNLFDSQPLVFTNVAKFVPPEIRHLNRQTDRQTDGHKSKFRLYIDRGERLGRVGSGKTTLDVKNSVLPRWRSAATSLNAISSISFLNVSAFKFHAFYCSCSHVSHGSSSHPRSS